jgi:hypothetical protein
MMEQRLLEHAAATLVAGCEVQNQIQLLLLRRPPLLLVLLLSFMTLSRQLI